MNTFKRFKTFKSFNSLLSPPPRRDCVAIEERIKIGLMLSHFECYLKRNLGFDL